jgi:hypothetical protein
MMKSRELKSATIKIFDALNNIESTRSEKLMIGMVATVEMAFQVELGKEEFFEQLDDVYDSIADARAVFKKSGETKKSDMEKEIEDLIAGVATLMSDNKPLKAAKALQELAAKIANAVEESEKAKNAE